MRPMTVQPLTVRPLSDALGAEVIGLDLKAPMPNDVVDALMGAWYENLVLVFRGQALTDEEHFRFTRQLGGLGHSPDQILTLDRAGQSEEAIRVKIGVISNIIRDGKPIGQLGNDEVHWHTDSSFTAVPPAASLLRAIEVPPVGGETYFMNMYRALETLPNALRAAIRGRQLKHDPTYTSAGVRRKEYADVTDPSQSPGPVHPIERLHPGSNRHALFLGRRQSSYVVGLPLAESEALLDQLWAHVLTQEGLVWGHTWQADDLVMWDNRCAMHRRGALDPNAPRHMRRTQLAGEVPVS
ncbi:MAG: TauD/TfdA family dioxygenase [Pseudomonadota bacterium]